MKFKKIICLLLSCTFIFVSLCISTFAADYETFTPFYGSVYTYGSSPRYASISVKWNANGITEFNAYNDTLEKDLVFYNYDRQAYATKCTSFQTELPNSYLDTQFLDNDNESVITAGTLSADELLADRMYTTHFTLSDYNSSSSMYKMQIQEGYYFIIEDKWTVMAQTTNTVIPFKNGFTAPENRGWYYEIEDNNSTSNAQSTSVGYWSSGTINSSNDIDYWKFSGQGSKSFRLICPSGTDYDFTIYDSYGNVITYNVLVDIDSETLVTLPSGTYYIKIFSAYGSNPTENYRLMITNT